MPWDGEDPETKKAREEHYAKYGNPDPGDYAPDPERDYARYLAEAQQGENALYRQLHAETVAANQASLQRQIQAGKGAIYGQGYLTGGGGALRGSAYAAGDLQQQGNMAGAALKAGDEQMFAQYYQDLLGRRGAYAQSLQDQSDAWYAQQKQEEARDAETTAANEAKDAEKTAKAAGIAISILGAGIGTGVSDVKAKQNIKSARYAVSDEEAKTKAYDAGMRKGAQNKQNEFLAAKWKAEGGGDPLYVTNRSEPADPEMGTGRGAAPLVSGRVRLREPRTLAEGRPRDFWDDSYDVMTLQSPQQQRNMQRLKRRAEGYGEAIPRFGVRTASRSATQHYLPAEPDQPPIWEPSPKLEGVPGNPVYLSSGDDEVPMEYDVGNRQFDRSLGETLVLPEERVTPYPGAPKYIARPGVPLDRPMDFDVQSGQFVSADPDMMYLPEEELRSDRQSKQRIKSLSAENTLLKQSLRSRNQGPANFTGRDEQWDVLLDDLDTAMKGGDPRAIAVAQGFVKDYVNKTAQAEKAGAALDDEGSLTMAGLKSLGPVNAGRRYAAEPAIPESEMGWTGSVPGAPIDLDRYQAQRLGDELDDEGSLTMASLRGSGPVRAPQPLRRDPRGRMLEERALMAEAGEDPYEGY